MLPITAADRRELWDARGASTLLDLIRIPATTHSDVPAFFVSPSGGELQAAPWGSLWRGALAQGARVSRAGGTPQEPVLLALPTSELFFHVFFGIHAAGCVPAPIALPMSLNVSRLDWYRELFGAIVRDSGARVVCTTSRFAAVFQQLAADLPSRPTVLAADEAGPAGDDFVCGAPPELALLQYTSGSTSAPKGVALTQANILTNARIICEAVAGPEESGVSWLPLYHDMGLIGAALSGLYGRTPVVFLPTNVFIKEPASWLRTIGRTGATITLAPNFAYGHALRHAPLDLLEGISLASLKVALNGAEPVDADTVDAFEAHFAPLGLRRGVVRPVYGLAESSLAVTFSEAGRRTIDTIDAEAVETAGRALPATTGRRRVVVAVGRALPTQEVRVVGADGAPLADRQVGEVVVRGPSVMRGYYGRPDESAMALRGGWLHTGDLGYMVDGEVFLTGRAKEMIVRLGRNYYPVDIERALAPLPGILRGGVVAFGVDAGGVEQVVVMAETRLRADEREALTRQIRARCHDAFLFGPDDVVLTGAGGIPRTTSGKVRRHECRRLYLAGQATGRIPATPDPGRTTGAPGPS